MRKLNKQNKFYIISLSIGTFIVLIIVLLFIINRFRVLNIKYNINENSYTYDENKELLKINDSTYAKKNLLNNYYVIVNDEKIWLYDNPVIFDEKNNDVLLLGTFFLVEDKGEVAKIKGENHFKPGSDAKIFKIKDRRYLVIADSIKSVDGFLKTNNYLLIDIDKVGNAYLYNDELNIKSFDELELTFNNLVFNINKEEITINKEVVDLTKIGGSTNTYKPKKVTEKEKENEGNSDGGNSSSSTIYPEEYTTDIVNTVTENEYVSNKTFVIDVVPDIDSAKVSYVVNDPLKEYKSVYAEVINLSDNSKNTVNLDLNDTKAKLDNLVPNTRYQINFYYSYLDSDNKEKSVIFDTHVIQTLNIKGNISLEMIGKNIVRYKVKIDKYILDSCNLKATTLNDQKTSEIDTALASKDGYVGEVNIDLSKGDMVTLSFDKCFYNKKEVAIEAVYKFRVNI